MPKYVYQQLYLSFRKIDRPEFPKFCLSWKRDFIFKLMCISQSFYRIWVVEVTRSESMNRHSESKNFQATEEKAIV